MPSRYVDIAAADGGRFKAYLTQPPGHQAPGIVLIQEIFGINPVMREVAERLAAAGFMVACPDLFWRQQPGVEITDRSDAEWQVAFALFKGFDLDKGVEDLKATANFLRAQPEGTGKVGCIGFCLGGRLAYLMAARSDVDCAVGYYGVGIEQALDEAKSIGHPLMLHVATKDRFVPAKAQAEIAAALGQHPKITIHAYPGQDHAFARIGGEHYDARAAQLADGRTLDFLTRNLA